ncbi:hypothetical protein [Streptomyces sp. PU-14G]|uniref:hypothetical protein n=1 Tax=Streptomyces sp. PU-14G TaxID=2800808 RepID=UPI0034DE3307
MRAHRLGRIRTPVTVGAVLALLVAAVPVWLHLSARAVDRDNDRVLARACEGALPADAVGEFVPDGERVRLVDNRGTLLAPGFSDRDLLTCRIEWDRDEDEAETTGETEYLTLTSVPLRTAPLGHGVRVEDLLSGGLTRPGTAPHIDDLEHGLVARCPKGLPGLGRDGATGERVTYFLVRVSALHSVHVPDAKAIEKAAARHILDEAGCAPGPGTTGPKVRSAALARYGQDAERGSDATDEDTPRACAWFEPVKAQLAAGEGWQDAEASPWRREAHGCRVERATEEQREDVPDAFTLTSAQWQGRYREEARTEYGRELRLLSPSRPSPPGGRRADHYDRHSSDRQVILWATARCGGEESLLRLSATGRHPDRLPDVVDLVLSRYTDHYRCHGTQEIGRLRA